MNEGYVQTNGVRLWYEQLGPAAGPPVLLVMGVGASAIWWPMALVRGLVDAGYRVVRFDNRDIGLSSHIDPGSPAYGLDDMVTDTEGLLDALEIESAHFVGVSLGGMISQGLALRSPARARSLALISSTPGPDDRLSPPTAGFLAFLQAPPHPDPSQQEINFARAFVGSRFPLDEPSYRSLLTEDKARGTNPNSRHGLVPQSAPSRLDALAKIQVPTLVIHGTEDPLFPYDHAEATARAIRGATLVPWQGVGHELPSEVVPDLLERLVRHVGQAELRLRG